MIRFYSDPPGPARSVTVNVVEHLKSRLTHEFDPLIIHQVDPLSRKYPDLVRFLI